MADGGVGEPHLQTVRMRAEAVAGQHLFVVAAGHMVVVAAGREVVVGVAAGREVVVAEAVFGCAAAAG